VYWLRSNEKSPILATTLALPSKPSIAVLAFQNMSGDPEQEYFADGIAEDVITALAVRRRAQFVLHLQGQVGRRSAGRARTWRPLRA
jgi:TolB-like protein